MSEPDESPMSNGGIKKCVFFVKSLHQEADDYGYVKLIPLDSLDVSDEFHGVKSKAVNIYMMAYEMPKIGDFIVGEFRVVNEKEVKYETS
jgi:hypothetical protein